MAALTRPIVEVAVASFTKPGETESGDCYLAKTDGDRALVLAVDGLGHGPVAAVACHKAVETAAATFQEPLTAVLQRCHAALQLTRGAVISLCRFNGADNTMTWLGVGNVEGVLLRKEQKVVPRREVLLLRSGIVGARLPPLREATLAVTPGDTLVLATDGVKASFFFDLVASGSVEDMARSILRANCLGTDDALVLVVRYLGVRKDSPTAVG